jgi:hypothetical protein
MCPCLVDIEIVDTRNGNESNLVTAGPSACACDDPGRKVGLGGWLPPVHLCTGSALCSTCLSRFVRAC